MRRSAARLADSPLFAVSTLWALWAFTGLWGLALCGCAPRFDFEPVTLGAEPEARAPRPRENGQYVRAIFADLAGRGPQVYDLTVQDEAGAEIARFPVDEAAFLDRALEDVGDPAPLRALLAAGLAGAGMNKSKAAVGDPAAFIAGQFRRLLGRDPTAYELHAFVGEWRRDPAVGPVTVVRALVGSREYQSF